MAINWTKKKAELETKLATLATTPLSIISEQGEQIVKDLKTHGGRYDKANLSTPVLQGGDVLGDTIEELDLVASKIDGSPAAPSTWSAAISRLESAKAGASVLELELIATAQAKTEPTSETAEARTFIKSGTTQRRIFTGITDDGKKFETIPTYYSAGELEAAISASMAEADEWLALA